MRIGFLSLLLGPPVAIAASAQTGTYPYGAFDSLGPDVINIGNLNTHLSIPIFRKPGRGLAVAYNLSYDSSIWTPVTTNGSTTWSLAQGGGWGGAVQPLLGYVSFSSQALPGGGSVSNSNVVYHDPYGGSHSFPNLTFYTTTSSPGFSTASASTVDGSGYEFNSTSSAVTITDGNGYTYEPPLNSTSGAGSITDTNGNMISVSAAGTVTDTLGLTALTVTDISSSAQYYTYTDTTGTSQLITAIYSPYTVQTAFGCSGISEYGPSTNYLIGQIAYPDGSTYNFTYEPTPGVPGSTTGRIQSVILPTGGVIKYTYTGSNNGISCADGAPMQMTRTLQNDPAGASRTYVRTVSGSTSSTAVTDGLSNSLVYSFVATAAGPYETHRQAYNGAATGTPVLDRVTCYNAVSRSSCETTSPTLPITQTDTYETSDGLIQRGSTITYDTYGNLISKTDYDYGSATARGPVLRSETITRNYFSGPKKNVATDKVFEGGVLVKSTTYSYDTPAPEPTTGLPQHVAESTARGNLTGYVVNLYDDSGNHGPSGNQTPIAVDLTDSFVYDDAGQLLLSYDATGNYTQYSYGTADAYLAGTYVNGTSVTSAQSVDTTTGLLMSSTVNGQATTYTYDLMLRPKTITSPDHGVTTLTYNASGSVYTNTPATVAASMLHTSGTSITQTATLDWYGRATSTDLTDDNGHDLTAYNYDANGNIASVSNPYKAGATPYFNSATYDVLGRQLTYKEPDCSGGICSTQSSLPLGNAVTITDETGHQRQLFSDGLDRTTKVMEPDANGYLTVETDYLYDQNVQAGPSGSIGRGGVGTVNNAPLYNFQTVVTQQGGTTDSTQWRTRAFSYDMLNRLMAVQTPEAGITTYTYGNSYTGFCAADVTQVCSRTDARNVVTNYTYDALSRLTDITYDISGANNTGSTNVAATPNIIYNYDETSSNGFSIQNGLGNLTSMEDGSGITVYSYDTMGRVTGTQKTIGTAPSQQASFNYNLDGTLNWIQDFSGTKFTYSYTAAGMQSGVSDQYGNNYANSGTYNAAGQLTSLTHQLNSGSASLQRLIGYDPARLQPQTIQATLNGSSYIQNLGLAYGTPGQNNGNITQITNAMDPTHNRDQTYSYDTLNRVLTGGDNSSWGEQYTYDNWGNLLAKTLIQAATNPYPVQWNNQMSNLTYDAAGNVTTDQLGDMLTYDAEGRLVSANSGVYLYDGNGVRVSKTDVNGTVTLYWPSSVTGDAASVVDESDATATNFGRQVFVAGLRVWSEDTSGNGKFVFQDQLGSTRVTADANGDVLDDLDYKSFGDVVTNYGSSPTGIPFVFTGYEDDSADSATDYAQMRNLSAVMGRFISPDPYLGSYDFTNPQSFNRYSYVTNSPLVYIDPLGMDHWEGNCYVTVTSGWEPNGNWGETASAQCFADLGGGDSAPSNGNTSSAGGGGGHGHNPLKPKPAPNKVPANPCAVAGRAPDPSVYAQKGQAGSSNAFTDIYNLLQFRRGAALDAQVRYGGAPSYANYTFGVYMAAAGYTLGQTLALADIYAEYRSSYPVGTPMSGPNYPFTPQANVANITNGFNAQTNGTTCHVGG